MTTETETYDLTTETYNSPEVHHKGKLYGTLIEPSTLTREQLLKVFDSAQIHIIKLHGQMTQGPSGLCAYEGYELMDDDKLQEFRD